MKRFIYTMIVSVLLLVPTTMKAQWSYFEIDSEGGWLAAPFYVTTNSANAPEFDYSTMEITVVDQSVPPPNNGYDGWDDVVFPCIEFMGCYYSGEYTRLGSQYQHLFFVNFDVYMNWTLMTSSEIWIDNSQGHASVNMFQRSQFVDPGYIYYTGSNPITLNTSPSMISGTAGCSNNGDPNLEYDPLTVLEYQWMKSEDGGTSWSVIPGANGLNLSPGSISRTTYFKRQARDGYSCWTSSTNIILYIPSNSRSTDKNYIFTSTPKYKIKNSTSLTIANLKADSTLSSISYFDGIGREIQTLHRNASPIANRSIVNLLEYDNMGRGDTKVYLPFAIDVYDNLYINDITNRQKSYYNKKFSSAEAYAYSQREYLKSGIGELHKQSGPGYNKSIGQHPEVFSSGIKTYYNSIDKLAPIKHLTMNGSSVEYSADYLDSKLMLASSMTQGLPSDQQSITYEYTNTSGQVIAKEIKTPYESSYIYYVYDNLGRLRYTIPDMQLRQMTEKRVYSYDELSKYCYYKEYDEYGRVIKTKNPDEDYHLFIYDKRGRLAMSQDGNQRKTNQWSFIKFDGKDREVLKGILAGGTYESHKTALENSTMLYETAMDSSSAKIHGYSNNSYPTAITTVSLLSVYYYDDYDWISSLHDLKSPSANYNFSSSNGLGENPEYTVLNNLQVIIAPSLLTGTREKVLGSGTDEWITSSIYYDKNSKAIQTIKDLYPSGMEITSNKHDFSGNVVQARVKQNVASLTYEYTKWFVYDIYGRLLDIKQNVKDDANGTVTIASYKYDDLGIVSSKSIHNGFEITSYEYNVAGAKITEQSPSFSYNLGFDKPASPGLSSRFDGNISSVAWSNNSDPKQKGYQYDYDNFGQLKNASFVQFGGTSWSTTNKFSEKDISYDKNGNIKLLNRSNAQGKATSYNYSYDGNRLMSLNAGDPGNIIIKSSESPGWWAGGAGTYTNNNGVLELHNKQIEEYLVHSPNFDPIPGQKATISFWAKKTDNCSSSEIFILNYDTYKTQGFMFHSVIENLTTEWKQYVFTFTCPATVTSLQTLRFDNNGSTNGQNSTVSIKDIVLTKGDSSPSSPSSPFAYDANGNMTYDGMSKFTIEYNALNLPQRIFASNGEIRYIYTASGEKLAAINGSSSTYYRSVMVYSKNGSSAEQLLYIMHPEGIVAKEGSAFAYKYFKRDHLGSTRALLAARNGRLEEEQRTDYYPFGLAHEMSNTHLNKYLFGGKEYQDAAVGSSGILGLYDFHARYYNPLLGRWFNTDPANQFFNPYAYCGNSPVMYVDPDGEYVHLIIGAVIGGAVNLAVNWKNIDNFGQGLAYFGIGAAAGALSAGIGAGVNVAMAGGSFGAGFMGTAVGVSSTGFIAGAATGAAAGFAGGFVTNSGNAWMSGANFGEGLWSGYIGGHVGALAGGLVGGVVGGIDASTKGINFWTGESSFDLSNAYSASGNFKIGEKTITGKYVGKFEDVNVFESAKLGDYYGADGYSGVTIPERGIITGKGVHTSGMRGGQLMMQHEYGHILQYRIVGAKPYYSIIAPESFSSASLSRISSWNHNTFWTETWANHLSKGYFGSNWLGNLYPSSYPAQNISTFNLIRLLMIR